MITTTVAYVDCRLRTLRLLLPDLLRWLRYVWPAFTVDLRCSRGHLRLRYPVAHLRTRLPVGAVYVIAGGYFHAHAP